MEQLNVLAALIRYAAMVIAIVLMVEKCVQQISHY
jgi:hypothetical protein